MTDDVTPLAAHRARGQGGGAQRGAAAGSDQEKDPHEAARTIALRLLTMAPRSRAQLEQKLTQRGCDPEVVAEVVDRLEAVGLIDDVAYAGMVVRSQHGSRGLARHALRQELNTKGVDRDTAEQALEQITEDLEVEKARALVAKKLRTMHGLEAATQTRRLAGMLARKGYPSSLVWQVVREAVEHAPEHQRD